MRDTLYLSLNTFANINHPWTLSIFHATLADTEAGKGSKSFRKLPIHNSQAPFNRLSTAGIPSCISFLSTAQYQLEACFFAPRLWHPKHRRRACHFVCLRCSKAPLDKRHHSHGCWSSGVLLPCVSGSREVLSSVDLSMVSGDMAVMEVRLCVLFLSLE